MPDELSPTMRALLAPLRAHWQAQDNEIAALDQHILIIARPYSGAPADDHPGHGHPDRHALVAASDDGQAFGRAGDRACWLGLVPRQHASGGKARLLGISKRGNGSLRRLLVNGHQGPAGQAAASRGHT